MKSKRSLWLLFSIAPCLLAACKKAPPEPEPERLEPASESKPASDRAAAASANIERASRMIQERRERLGKAELNARQRPTQKVSAKPVASVRVSPDDPLKGKFDLEQAVAGLPKEGTLIAQIQTDAGNLDCELFEDKAPITVANFVGLARGLRPFKDPSGTWVKKPAYDGTGFHRIIKGFMIQGGDPTGTGTGEPGYVIPDEIWENAHHSERGLLCMANRGPNTNGAQFFIMDGPALHLDGGYTIFGKCGPDETVEKLASTPTMGDRAVNPPKMNKVVIRRQK